MLVRVEKPNPQVVRIIAGVDISKLWFDVTVISLCGAVKESHEQFSNDTKGFRRFMRWLKANLKKAEVEVVCCMEATGSYWKKLATWLNGNDCRVFVVNPARIKGYFLSEQKRSKTDKVDSGVIARFCKAQMELLPVWMPPRAAVLELQQMVRTRSGLVDARSRFKAMLSSGSIGSVASYLVAQVKELTARIKQLEAAIQKLIKDDQVLKQQFDSAKSFGKGAGLITVATFIAECREFRDFCNSKQVVAFAGFDVSRYDSGSSIHGKPRISKKGNARLRSVFYLAAQQGCKRNPALMPLYQRLLKKGLTKKAAIVACARKMMELMYTLIKSESKFDLAFYQSKIMLDTAA